MAFFETAKNSPLCVEGITANIKLLARIAIVEDT